jgi:hypothetical protein
MNCLQLKDEGLVDLGWEKGNKQQIEVSITHQPNRHLLAHTNLSQISIATLQVAACLVLESLEKLIRT